MDISIEDIWLIRAVWRFERCTVFLFSALRQILKAFLRLAAEILKIGPNLFTGDFPCANFVFVGYEKSFICRFGNR